MRLTPLFLVPLLLLPLLSSAQNTRNFPAIGEVVRLDPAFDKLVPKDATIDVVAGGFQWAEGPVWVPDDSKNGGHILFSDIPNNRVVKWVEGTGWETWLKPAGFSGPSDYGNEPGCNGLLRDHDGLLISCEHGDRRISRLTKDGGKRTVADNWQGKRFNSPNDACIHKNGDIYFTDPIYGLPGKANDPRREIDFCGVYRVDTKGEVTLLTDEFTRPNGICFSPDQKTLYVAQSDPGASIYKKFPVKADGTLGPSELFFDATPHRAGKRGLPDGIKCDVDGNLWATGPGGVWVFNPDGKPLGRIDPKEATANCGWGGKDGSILYLTSDMYLCRIQTSSRGW